MNDIDPTRIEEIEPLYGVYPSIVGDIVDPDGEGRVRVSLPWMPGERYEPWARVATLMAGDERGSWFIPDVDDEVLVAFGGGDPRRPYVVGALWNVQDAPPVEMDPAGENNVKKIRSRNGVEITIDDRNGQEQLTLRTPGGQRVQLGDGHGTITVEDSNGNSVTMEASGIVVTSPGKVTINAGTVEVSASMLTVDAGVSKFSMERPSWPPAPRNIAARSTVTEQTSGS